MEDSRSRLDELKREHRELDRRIDELCNRPYLLPQEEIEIQRMKKLKLTKKDEIFRLEREMESATRA